MGPENLEAISRSAKLPPNLEVIHTNRLLVWKFYINLISAYWHNCIRAINISGTLYQFCLNVFDTPVKICSALVFKQEKFWVSEIFFSFVSNSTRGHLTKTESMPIYLSGFNRRQNFHFSAPSRQGGINCGVGLPRKFFILFSSQHLNDIFATRSIVV